MSLNLSSKYDAGVPKNATTNVRINLIPARSPRSRQFNKKMVIKVTGDFLLFLILFCFRAWFNVIIYVTDARRLLLNIPTKVIGKDMP